MVSRLGVLSKATLSIQSRESIQLPVLILNTIHSSLDVFSGLVLCVAALYDAGWVGAAKVLEPGVYWSQEQN